MATITASGTTKYGKATAKVKGDKYVEKVECDNDLLLIMIKEDIHNAENIIANYAPPANTMLQAYATLRRYFGYQNIKKQGDIGEIPAADNKERVIY